MNNKKWVLIASLIVIVAVGAYFIGKNSNNQAQVMSVSTSTESNQGPASSAILDKATPPTYSGADLVTLRQECAAQAQEGLNKFAQSQNQIANEYGLPQESYTLDQYHFNETLGACLIEIDDSFSTSNKTYNGVAPDSPADTTYLVNIYENKAIMNCTAYGEPVTSRLCYDDQGNPGNLVSYQDWTDILNQYMNQ